MENIDGNGIHGSGIQQYADSLLLAIFYDLVYGRQGNFMLQNDQIRIGEQSQSLGYIIKGYFSICAWNDDDPVPAVFLHKDRGGSRG